MEGSDAEKNPITLRRRLRIIYTNCVEKREIKDKRKSQRRLSMGSRGRSRESASFPSTCKTSSSPTLSSVPADVAGAAVNVRISPRRCFRGVVRRNGRVRFSRQRIYKRQCVDEEEGIPYRLWYKSR
jgi:hypothetical protein